MVERQQSGVTLGGEQSIPWKQLEDYIKTHDKVIGSLLSLRETHKSMNIEALEKFLPDSFLKLQACIDKILRDNHITQNEEQKKVQVIVEAVMNIQKQFSKNSNKDSGHIEQIMRSMKQTLEQSFDQSMSSHIDEVVSQMSGMTDFFESKFDEFRSRFDTLEYKIDEIRSNQNAPHFQICQNTNENGKRDEELQAQIIELNAIISSLKIESNEIREKAEQEIQEIRAKCDQQIQELTRQLEEQIAKLPPPVQIDIENFLPRSKCATDEERRYLKKELGNKEFVTTILYQGSVHGKLPINFHQQCDNKGPSITLCKIKKGSCIAGKTNAQWTSEDVVHPDDQTFLYNLSQKRTFPCKQQPAIYCNKQKGPCFGNLELCIQNDNKSFDEEDACYSKVERKSFEIEKKDGYNLLTNLEDEDFSAEEVEVWSFVEVKSQA